MSQVQEVQVIKIPLLFLSSRFSQYSVSIFAPTGPLCNLFLVLLNRAHSVIQCILFWPPFLTPLLELWGEKAQECWEHSFSIVTPLEALGIW